MICIKRWSLLCLAVLCIANTQSVRAQPASVVQLPTFGVAIDADGVLSVKRFPAMRPRVAAALVAEAAARGEAIDADVFSTSPLRKISLVRLRAAVRKSLDAGKAPNQVMAHLAGLQRIQYVFYLPKSRDIIIAGPAEAWVDDPSGRARGAKSGCPVLHLEDLVVALRAFGIAKPDRSRHCRGPHSQVGPLRSSRVEVGNLCGREPVFRRDFTSADPSALRGQCRLEGQSHVRGRRRRRFDSA